MDDVGSHDVDPHDQTAAESVRPVGLRAGLVLGGFELIEVLGEGGMGVVWSAHDPTLDRTLAIKVLKRSDAHPSLRKRLLREARAMARLKHPNVLTVYEVGTEGERDYIAMELVEGGSLDDWLDNLPPRDEVWSAVLAAGRGLAAAHAAGLVHRDFKPHNVLRSRDGRVLVTDFGLARGLGDDSTSGESPEPELPSGARVVGTDSILDSPLTQTGALIGTPAYMAPEQFNGAAPDPRTDQFAFSVTAWQALTGLRPYTGASIEELRAAAMAGVQPSLKVDLPPEVRAALVRGMDPDPAKRWASLDELLDVLERAVRPRRSAWVWAAIVVALAGAIAGAVAIGRKAASQAPAIATGCAPGEDPFAEAWSPARRSKTLAVHAARGVPEASSVRVADALDGYRARWTQALANACKAPEKLGARQRACLLGARDQTAALALLVHDGTAPMIAKLDVLGMLPDVAGCTGDTPNAPTPSPEDPQVRARVIAVTAKALAMNASPTLDAAGLEAEAAAVGWPPMLPLMQMNLGNAYLRRGDHVAARAMMNKVLAAPPEARDAKITALARFGLLDAALAELEDPASDAKPGELHGELARLLTYARADVKAAGGEPTLAAALASFEARANQALAQWGRYPKALDEALAQAKKAVALYTTAGDLRRAAQMSAIAAEITAQQRGPNALDDAMFAARTAAEALAAAKLDPVPMLDATRAWIELRRGDYATAEALLARLAGPAPDATGPTVTGVVVGAGGEPVANARVVAWRGTLAGDPKHVVTDPSALDGEIVDAGPDGAFTVHAQPGDALIGEAGDLRSHPQVAAAGPLRLVVEKTDAIGGSVEHADLLATSVIARYPVGAQWFEVRAPVHEDGLYRFAGLPGAAPAIGLYGDAAEAQRRILARAGATELAWPTGEALDVIARGGAERDATAWVLRGAQAPKTRAEAEALAEHATEVAWAPLVPIGADNTDAGRAVYQAGDRHAVIGGNTDGDVSVCVARQAAATSPVTCAAVTVRQTVPGGVTPVIIVDGGRGTPAR